MSQNRPILYLHQSCGDAVQDFVMRINRAGLFAIRTFDLHDTRDRETACPCPHHGTAHCDCQMVVILVYGEDDRPASVVVHGHNGQTWFSLVESLGMVNPRLEDQICGILAPSELDFTAGDTT